LVSLRSQKGIALEKNEMKKTILLLIFVTGILRSFSVTMNDVIVYNISLLQGTKLCKNNFNVNDNKAYFLGSDRKLYRVDMTGSAPVVVCITDITVGGYLNAADNSDLVTDGASIFFKENSTNRVASYWFDGTNWHCGVLLSSSQPVASGGAISYDNSNRLFYNGSDQKVYQLTWTGNNWTSTALPNGMQSIAAGSDLLALRNHIFYVGTDNKIYEYYYNGSWNPGFPCPTAPLAASGTNLNMDEADKLFYTASDLKVYYISWTPSNGWAATLVNNATVKQAASPKTQDYCGKVYYVDNASNTISYFFYNTGNWTAENVTGAYYSYSNSSDILVTNNGDLMYNNSDGKVHLLSPIIDWKTETIAVGLTALKENGQSVSETILLKKKYPENYQFYPRNSNNIGIVACEGSCWGNYSIELKTEKTDFWGNTTSAGPISFILDQNGQFAANLNINAELSEYKVSYKLKGQNRFTVLADKLVCGDAYIAGGQSNMSADDNQLNNCDINSSFPETGTNGFGKYSRSYGNVIKGEPPRYWTVSRFYNAVNCNDNQKSPVGEVILALQYNLQKNHQIPICVLNGAIGSTMINDHILASNKFYYEYGNCISGPNDCWHFKNILGHLMRRIYSAGLENDIKGFLWYQGEGDVAGYSAGTYKTKFKQLYDGLAANIPALSSSTSYKNTKTYLFQIASSGPFPNSNLLSEDQRSMPSFIPYANITVIPSNGAHYPNCSNIHFDEQGYEEISSRALKVIGMQLYGASYNANNMPLEIVSVVVDNTYNTVTLEFNQNIFVNSPDNIYSVLNNIRLSNTATKYSPSVYQNKFSFYVTSTSGLTSVGYLGDLTGCSIQSPGCVGISPSTPGSSCTPGPFDTWTYGWWCDSYIRNTNGDAALSFYNFPITLYCPSCERTTQQPLKIKENEKTADETRAVIYPNPTENEFHVHSGSPLYEIIIIDISGRVCISKKITNETDIEISTSELKNGVYTVLIKSENETINKKLTVIH
jgi:hypothetical protein